MLPPLTFLSDQATKVDLLYFEAVSKTIVDLIVSHGEQPLSLGVHGDWGAGKSSVLEMIEAGFSGDSGTLCLRFNGWQYQGFEDAKAALIESIITGLTDARPVEGVLHLGGKLLGRLNYLKLTKMMLSAGVTVATGIPHPEQLKDALSLLKGIKDSITTNFSAEEAVEKIGAATELLNPQVDKVLPTEIREFHSEFSQLIEKAGIQRLVVLIDDMDRCLPETTIDTLEAIRLFLFAKKTTFVIAADEAMIEYCVKQHFPDLPAASGPLTYAKNYLEKLIQVPFRIPALGYIEAEAYIALTIAESTLPQGSAAFQQFLTQARELIARPWLMKRVTDDMAVTACSSAGGSAELEKLQSAIQLSHQIGATLNDGTRGNPRQIKRFLNALFLRERVAVARGLGSEITRHALAKVMLAEFFSPAFYTELRDATSRAPNGKPAELRALEEAKGGEKEKSETSGSTWAEQEWAVMWSKISPPLADIDLRPYHFITSDRRSHFAGSTAFAHLSGLLEVLESGKQLALKSKADEIKRLNAEEAQQLFNVLADKIHQTETYSSSPDGLLTLVSGQPILQASLLSFVTGISTKKLGVWSMGAGMKKRFTGPGLAEKYEQFVSKCKEQSENPSLAAAAKSFASTAPTRTRR